MDRTDPRHRPLNSVSSRIVLCVFVSTLVTALVVSWLSVSAIHDDVRRRVAARGEHLLEDRQAALERWHSEASFALAEAAAIGTPWHEALLRAQSAVPSSASLHWVTEPAEGTPQQAPLLSTLPKPPTAIANEFDRLSLSAGSLARRGAAGCLSASTPITRENDEVVGQLEGCLSVEKLYAALMPRKTQLKGFRLLLLSPDGQVMTAAGIRGQSRVGDQIPLHAFTSHPDPSFDPIPDDGLVDYVNGEGDRMLGMMSTFAHTGWRIVLEADRSQALSPALTVTRQIFIVDVCLLILFSAFAYKITQAMMQPIAALSAGAQRISSGQLDYQIPPPANRDNEMGIMTQTFNSMVTKLHKNQKEIEQDRIRLAEKNEELQRANEILAQLSITDGLTKLHNHRYFQDHLTREIKRVSRTKAPLSLVLLDIDDFKLLNDTHGHAAGDEVLQSLAAIMNDSARESDLIARYGGEEFVILMPNTDLAGAVRLAEKIRMSVESSRLIIGTGMKPVEITISIGVALYTGVRKDFFVQADKALYQAKAAGKNCVIIAANDDSKNSVRSL